MPAKARPSGLDGHYPAVRYYTALRLLLGHSAFVLSSSGPPATLAGTQQISRGKTLRFRRDRVATTPPVTRQEQGIAAAGQLTPPEERLTALHFRSQPQRIYGFFQTRPHGSLPALNAHAQQTAR
ncbi:MAG: hypothetical protein LC777_03135 [Actinobacteria bacterium]|nr:hypothetical protein [Actinomycetota bacterium]